MPRVNNPAEEPTSPGNGHTGAPSGQEVPHHHHEAPPAPKKDSWSKRWFTTVLGMTVGTIVGIVVARKFSDYFPARKRNSEEEGEDPLALGDGFAPQMNSSPFPWMGSFNAAPPAPAPIIVNTGAANAPPPPATRRRKRPPTLAEARQQLRDAKEAEAIERRADALADAEAEAEADDEEWYYKQGRR